MLLSLRWVTIVIIFFVLPSSGNAEVSLDQKKQALDIITDFADRFCKDIPLEGSGDSVELSGDAKSELSGIVKKLAKLGVSDAGKYQNSDYQGLLQKDIIEGLKSNLDCRLKIWGDLKSTLLVADFNIGSAKSGQNLAQKKQSLPDKETDDRYIKRYCGSIIDSTTNIEWFVGPNKTMTWYEARDWTKKLSSCQTDWRMPTTHELATLYDEKQIAGIGFFAIGKKFPNGRRFPAKIHPIFDKIGEGAWVWTSDEPTGSQATAHNLNQNMPTKVDALNQKYTTRAFAVRRF